MTALGGYADRIARINLSEGKIEYESVPDEWARLYIEIGRAHV